MRRLIVSNLISLDGFPSGPGGDVMALPFDTTFSDCNLELMQAADTLVSGATTYRGFLSYWPPVADDPAQPEVERAISRRHRELEHLVISDTLTAEETGPWRDNTRIVRRDEAEDIIAQAKRDEGGPLVTFGSIVTWNGLLAAGLIDELHIMVGAGVLIDGVPAFSVRPPGPMRLTAARQLGDSNIGPPREVPEMGCGQASTPLAAGMARCWAGRTTPPMREFLPAPSPPQSAVSPIAASPPAPSPRRVA